MSVIKGVGWQLNRIRKSRAWVTLPNSLNLLGKGAKRSALRASVQLTDPRIRRVVARLAAIIADERRCKLAQGDVLVALIDRHQLRPIDIARKTKQRPSDLSHMYHTCRMFPRRVRRQNVPYNIYHLATRMVRKFKRLRLAPDEVLAEIRRLGFSQHRQVTAHFSAMAVAATAAVAPPAALDERGEYSLNRMYHSRFQSLLPIFANASIRVLHIDPPYVYPKRANGRYAASSSRSLSCDNRDAADAIELVVDLLRDWQIKIAPGGALLLWQPSGQMPREISDAIDGFQWDVDRVVIWDKGRPQAGDLSSAYQTQCEWLWVLKRPGDRLLNHDNSPRGDIIRFAPASAPSLAGSQQHAFEKPADLCKFLVGKHSRAGELIFDCCGCTGSMSMAAIEMGRQWVYAESNAQNHLLGSNRIATALDRTRAVAV